MCVLYFNICMAIYSDLLNKSYPRVIRYTRVCEYNAIHKIGINDCQKHLQGEL